MFVKSYVSCIKVHNLRSDGIFFRLPNKLTKKERTTPWSHVNMLTCTWLNQFTVNCKLRITFVPFLTAGSFLLSGGVRVKVIVHGIRNVRLRSRENSVLIPPTTLSFTIKWKLGCRSRKQKRPQITTPRSGTWGSEGLCSQNNRSRVQKHWTRRIVLMIIIWKLKQRERQKVIGFDWQNNNSASYFHVLWMTGTKHNDFLLFLLWYSIFLCL